MSDTAVLELLNGLAKRLEEDLSLVRKLSEMSDDARTALSLPIDAAARTEERIRVKVLETVVGEVCATVAKVSTVKGCCDAWAELNGGRIVCQREMKHEGRHSATITGRVGKDRIDATLAWEMAPFIKAV